MVLLYENIITKKRGAMCNFFVRKKKRSVENNYFKLQNNKKLKTDQDSGLSVTNYSDYFFRLQCSS